MLEINRKWDAYYSFLADHEELSETFSDEFVQQVVDYMVGEKIIDANVSVLDIGAGTGSFSIPFAKVAAEVTALDMSWRALAAAEKKAAESELDNITFTGGMWETAASQFRHRVIFCSMCPVIQTWHDIEKMEQSAAKTCCILTVTKGSAARHRRNLRRKLIPDKLPGMAKDGKWFYDSLYERNRSPSVRTFHEHKVTPIPLDAANEMYRIYFRIFGLDGQTVNQVIDNYLKDNEENGFV